MEKRKTALFPLNKESHFLIFCIVMLCVMCIAMFMAMRMGSVEIDSDIIKGVLVNKLTGREYYPADWEFSLESIIWDIRAPRVFTAFIVGAGLTMCGILMQVLTKNSLADPYMLGISHGASAGAVSVIMYGYLWFLGGYGTMAGAFMGALISIVLAIRIASVRKTVSATQLVLAGIAVNA
ncbi:MAG: iron chelate uptake ABC transporter family permease subunit, partial [Firmicutes bacterium]|nr:iron chelate uptake ABC transporter family permease subunit [Bacillota bacterium]